MISRSDSDRRHPLHDAICAYHADEEVATALAEALLPERSRPARLHKSTDWWRRNLGLDYRCDKFTFTGQERTFADGAWGSLETPVYADRGRYKQLIGHLDVYMGVQLATEYVGEVRWVSRSWTGGVLKEEPHAASKPPWRELSYVSIAVEVKAIVTSLGDLVRQIQRYRHEWTNYDGSDGEEIIEPKAWVVSSPGMSDGLQGILKEQNIVGIRPGAKFLDWCRAHGLTLPPDALRILSSAAQLSLPEGTRDVRCRECGARIPETVKACPECDAPRGA